MRRRRRCRWPSASSSRGPSCWLSSGRRLNEAATLAPEPDTRDETAPLDLWQTAKGMVVAAAIVAAFLFTALPREVVALTGAGVLLTSRKLHSRRMLGLVDWELLVLFMGLFVVNHALQKTGLPDAWWPSWRHPACT